MLVSIRFLLHNFVEMNKLWTRMQQMGGQVNVERRERERQVRAALVLRACATSGCACDARAQMAPTACSPPTPQELSDLVGKNLMYLSQLGGLDFRLYRDLVLPKVTEQIVSCEDTIAQQYLMQVQRAG